MGPGKGSSRLGPLGGSARAPGAMWLLRSSLWPVRHSEWPQIGANTLAFVGKTALPGWPLAALDSQAGAPGPVWQ